MKHTKLITSQELKNNQSKIVRTLIFLKHLLRILYLDSHTYTSLSGMPWNQHTKGILLQVKGGWRNTQWIFSAQSTLMVSLGQRDWKRKKKIKAARTKSTLYSYIPHHLLKVHTANTAPTGLELYSVNVMNGTFLNDGLVNNVSVQIYTHAHIHTRKTKCTHIWYKETETYPPTHTVLHTDAKRKQCQVNLHQFADWVRVTESCYVSHVTSRFSWLVTLIWQTCKPLLVLHLQNMCILYRIQALFSLYKTSPCVCVCMCVCVDGSV